MTGSASVDAASPTRQLAARLVDRYFTAHPTDATELGLRGYDAGVPDASVEAEEALADDLRAIAGEASTITADTTPDVVTLAVIRATCAGELRTLAMRSVEFSVAPIPVPTAGPPDFVATLARTVLPDPQAAQDYLARVSASGEWVDGVTARLRDGAARGRHPVGSLVDETIAWADRTLADPVPPSLTTPSPPDGWDGATAWRAALDDAVRSRLVPALVRWRAQLHDLRATARDDEHVGLGALPGGVADYENAIAVHTTLPFSADELHQIGIDAVARLEERATELGAKLGLATFEAVRDAARASTSAMDADAALALARDTVLRAEARASEIMPSPLPDPCVITPMPQTVAEAGMAPHYSPPREDGSRPGTFWFNTMRPTAGTGWDLEAVVFHETVPGHHSQLARLQRIPDLPLLQRLVITTHAEGWGLYAERLAGEFGLYSSVEAEIGSVFVELFRAARLVVDTGMHAMGWSRRRAQQYFIGKVALAEGFLLNEIDRYIAWPGQALAYLVGQREILRLRDLARDALGGRFDLPSFNAAVLDSGNLPMPVLGNVVGSWVNSQADG